MNGKNQLLDVLTRKGVLINVSVRYWRATRKLAPEDLGLDPESVEKRLFSLGHKNLIPKGMLQNLALIESRTHALMDTCTFPFLNGLGHFLPNTRLEETMAKLGRLEQEFMAEKSAFLGKYGDTRDAALAEWREAASRLGVDPVKLVETIEESFPTPERMERAFGFTTQLFQISVPEGFTLDEVSLHEQQEVIQAREQAVRDARERIQYGVENFIGDCVASLREQTATLCEEMLESMKSGKTGVHQKTLNRLVNFINEFKTLNFVGDSQLEEQLENVRRELLSRTAEQYRDNTFYHGKLKAGLQSLASTARDMARQDAHELVERFGQMGQRRIMMGPVSPADTDGELDLKKAV
jgi:hypothetical protein